MVTMDTAGGGGDAAGLRPDDRPAETRLVYDGSVGTLLVLWLKILGLNIITLGFYRFWGRTRIRKYLWSHVSLLGDRFEYDGTGGELFRRFLVAIVIFGPILFMVDIATLLGAGARWLAALKAVQLVLFVYLAYFATYAGRRYRMSRTLWRNIRGGLDGSANIYALRAFGYLLLSGVTLGFATPWQYVGLWRYEMSNSGFGDDQFQFEGSGRHLLRPFVLAWVLNIVVLVLVGCGAYGIFHLAGGKLPVPGRPMPMPRIGWPAIFGLIFLLYLAYLVAAACIYLYFNARALSYYARGTRFRAVSFSAPITLPRLLWLQLGNLLLMIFTLGLGTPFTAHRYVRFFCDNLRLYGAEDLEKMSQEPGRRRPKGGEGLVQLLDTGGFA
jgi:uncharacterized membrane protein YjgN (DUF898 family)